MCGWKREAHGARGLAAVPGDTVPFCLVAMLLMVVPQGFFLCWQQRGGLMRGIIIIIPT